MFSARDEMLDKRYIDDSKDPKNSMSTHLLLRGGGRGGTSLAPVRKKLPIEPLRKSNLDPGLDSLDMSL
jgi:hypothetical protein